jgi:hypothetical protein
LHWNCNLKVHAYIFVPVSVKLLIALKQAGLNRELFGALFYMLIILIACLESCEFSPEWLVSPKLYTIFLRNWVVVACREINWTLTHAYRDLKWLYNS